jgi:hypothetical protein
MTIFFLGVFPVASSVRYFGGGNENRRFVICMQVTIFFFKSLSEKSNFLMWQVFELAVPQPISGWVEDNTLRYRFILFCREVFSLTLVR